MRQQTLAGGFEKFHKKTRKENQWFFGMKAHIGVDSRTKLIHSVVATAANIHDSRALEHLLHSDETHVYGDSTYRGKKDVIQEHAPDARDFTQDKASRHRKLSDEERSRNRLSRVSLSST